MRIEMGESLIYSYLRHVKKCHIVQTNWKTSPQWDILAEKKLLSMMEEIDNHFTEQYGYKIFKKNASLSQLLQQAELDAIGVGRGQVYAVEVAYHQAGLGYGGKEENTLKILAKMARAVFVCYGYMNLTAGEVIFASPKIHKATIELVEPCIADLQKIIDKYDLNLHLRLLYNSSFEEEILNKVLALAGDVNDESELFLRSYQLVKMFDK